MKRLIGTPLKATAFLTLVAGIVCIILTLYLLFIGLALLVIAGVLYVIDAVIIKQVKSRKRLLRIQIPISVAYLITWFFLIMQWQAHTDIIFPKNFNGEAGIVFGIEGYPKLPTTRFWKKEIHLPEDGLLITSTKEEDLPNWYRFKRADGYEYRFDEIEVSITSSFPCLKNNKYILYASYHFEKDSTFAIQQKLAALCNQINQGKASTLYSTDYSYVTSNVDKPYLNLQGMGLAYLPDAVASLPIKQAILTQNKFTHIPNSILQNQGIEWLLLSHNPIKDIPQEICQLKRLKWLALNSTRIRNITTDLSGLDSLQDLDLANNELDSLPKQVYNLPNLKELSIANNRFKNFSFVNKRLNRLEILDLNSNRIKSITNETKHLTNLKELEIFSNLIDSIPDNIKDLSSLEELHITDNPITYISPRIAELKKLKSIMLDDDRLTGTQKELLRKWLPNCEIHFQTSGKKNYY